MYDLIIIGGGPSAAAAAFYALDKQLNFVMIYEELGGKVGQRESLLRYDVSDGASSTRRYVRRGDRDVAELIPALPTHRLVRLLVGDTLHSGHVRHDQVLQISRGVGFFGVETRDQGLVQANSVLLATGATPRLLDVPGADRLIDRGMDYSITTYAQQVAGQRVAVIGDTQRALLGVAELARTTAQVYLIAPDAERLSTPLGIALHHQTNVEVHAGAEITEVCGERAIEALALRIAGATRRVLVDRAFVDLGLVPNSALVRGLVDTDAHGFVVVDQHNSTSLPGLFAAGDVTTTSGEHALVAVGDGVRAAQSAHRYLLVEWLAESRRTVR